MRIEWVSWVGWAYLHKDSKNSLACSDDHLCWANRGDPLTPGLAEEGQMFLRGEACQGRWKGFEHNLVLRREELVFIEVRQV